MALPKPKPAEIVGSTKPRLAPPTPARTESAAFEAAAKEASIDLMPWQREAGRYTYATNTDGNWLYREIAIIVARQNGKSLLLLPLILDRLGRGRRIVHAAQSRDLPRKFFERRLAPEVQRQFGSKARIRKGAGQESIEVAGGGSYTIVAGTGGAPRGQTFDDILLDEVRELKPDFVFAVMPTNIASKNRQTIYLSNAGSEDSTVLNQIRLRAEEDPGLAWLEWSAAPERAVDDRIGWAEANPGLGHILTTDSVAAFYTSNKLAGTLAAFETEHLCRWVQTMRERFVDPAAWALCAGPLGTPRSPDIGISMSPDGKRASVAVAWMIDPNTVGLRMAINATGNPIPPDQLGRDIKALAEKVRARSIGFDPLTDAELAKHVKKATPINGQKFANASAVFVNRINSRGIVWADAEPITDDLTWTSRKHDHETGSFQAVRAQDDRSITASLAAIRAVYLASGKEPTTPRIY